MNGIEHLCFVVPALLFGSIFRPKLVIGASTVVLVGWELYAYGYQQPEGANSLIREIGGISAVLMELLCIGSMLGIAIWRRGLHKRIHNRKFYKNWGLSQYERLK